MRINLGSIHDQYQSSNLRNNTKPGRNNKRKDYMSGECEINDNKLLSPV